MTFISSLKTTQLGASGLLTARRLNADHPKSSAVVLRAPLFSSSSTSNPSNRVDYSGRAVLLTGIPKVVSAGTVLLMLRDKEFMPIRGEPPAYALNDEQKKLRVDQTANGIFVYVAEYVFRILLYLLLHIDSAG